MTFYGQENNEPSASKSSGLRKYSFKTWGGLEKEIEANYIQFQPNHVTFWLECDGDKQDILVLAEANTNVTELSEVIAA